MDSLAVGDLVDILLEGIVAVVDEDDMFGADDFDKGSLFLGRSGANDVSAEKAD